MTCNIKNPPKLEDEAAYESWKNDVTIWTDLTDLPKEKQALAIHLSLSGRARIASSEIAVADLKKDDGVSTIIKKLDNLFLADEGRRQFGAFHNLYNFRRSEDVEVDRFISEFEHLYFKFSEQKMTLPDSVQAFMLLAACNLSEDERKLVMSAITVVTYENMKSALKRIFARQIALKLKEVSSAEIKVEPLYERFEHDNSDVLYVKRGRETWLGGARRGSRFGTSAVRGAGARLVQSRTNERTRGRGNVHPAMYGSRQMNPLNRNGEISRCMICDSKFHWARNCPDAYENKEEREQENCSDTNETDEVVHMALFMGNNGSPSQAEKLQNLLAESSGHAILDTGCSATVCGLKWFNSYVDELSSYDKSKIVENKSASSFTFGDGAAVKSLKKVTMPCYLGSKRSTVTTDIVECGIPLLLSKKSMKKASMCLDFKNDTVKIGKDLIHLSCSTSGHYLLPISL